MTINPTTPEAIALAKDLLAHARFAALAVTDPETSHPFVSRVAVVPDHGTVLTLISTLSPHTKALKSNPNCAVLIGEPGPKGDPLTHPRMTCSGTATQIAKTDHKALWLAAIPKAQLYFDFADFEMYRITPTKIALNGGFGKAFDLNPEDVT